VPGFYLGSAHVAAAEPFHTVETKIVVRPKPQPDRPAK